GGSVAIGRFPHEQASADTANAGKPGPRSGGPQPRNNGVAPVRRRRTHLRASTGMQSENGAGDRFTAGAGPESWRHHRIWDPGAFDVGMVAGGFASAWRHQD